VVDLAARRVNALGGWDTQVTVTTADDIGALTAAILRAEPRLANQVVYVAGDTVSYRQLADTVDRALGIETQRQARTVSALMRELAAAPGDPMRKYRAVFAQGRGVAWDPAR
ncbi:Rossmann-fold NAD(P)-binding domain-containing protein, partial [Achromobacter xylosoxidans]